jgi:adenine-specific DNA-methyltransferase
VPNNILRTTVYDDIRRKLASSYTIDRIVSLGPAVFPGVTASTIILLLKNQTPGSDHDIEVIDNQLPNNVQNAITNHISQAECLENPSCVIDIFTDSSLKKIFLRMDRKSVRLGELVEVLNGIATHKNKSGILDARKDANSKPILFGKDVARYYYSWSGKYVDYVRDKLLRPRDEGIFLVPEKLVMQRIGGILVTAYDDQKFYTFNSINNLVLKEGTEYNLKYLLGILNSRLIQLYYVTKFTNRSTLTVNLSKTFLDEIPIRKLNLNDPYDATCHDRIVELVEQMLSIKKQLAISKTDHDKTLLQRQSEVLENQIDQLVYALYSLTEKDVEIIGRKTI